MSDNQLGAFLRGRREAVSPAEVGLPVGSRRRTPGLRRAELATLAGVSVEYLTRLEQGRDRHPSAEVLGTLGAALRLSTDEQIHLRILAKAAGDRGWTCTGSPTRSVRPTVQRLLTQLEPAPAYVLNRVSDLVAFTSGFERLAGPVGLLDGAPANRARFIFADDRARTVLPDWERIADAQVAYLKTKAIHSGQHIEALAEELAAVGPAFTDRWQAPPAMPRSTGVERWCHPEVGTLQLAYEAMALADSDQDLVVYLPADQATSAALDQLAGRRPGALHAVSA